MLLLLGSELLLLLELLEVLVEVLVVELLGSGLVGVELGSIEDSAKLVPTWCQHDSLPVAESGVSTSSKVSNP